MGEERENLIHIHEDERPIGFFSLRGRTNRRDFVKVMLAVLFFSIINQFVLMPGASTAYLAAALVMAILFRLATWPITIRRLHDTNHHGGYFLVEIIPPIGLSFFTDRLPLPLALLVVIIAFGFVFYYLILILGTGDSSDNNYGPPNPPQKYGNKTINVFCISIVLLTVLAGIFSKI